MAALGGCLQVVSKRKAFQNSPSAKKTTYRPSKSGQNEKPSSRASSRPPYALLTQGIKPSLAVDRAMELSLHHFNRLAIHL